MLKIIPPLIPPPKPWMLVRCGGVLWTNNSLSTLILLYIICRGRTIVEFGGRYISGLPLRHFKHHSSLNVILSKPQTTASMQEVKQHGSSCRAFARMSQTHESSASVRARGAPVIQFLFNQLFSRELFFLTNLFHLVTHLTLYDNCASFCRY